MRMGSMKVTGLVLWVQENRLSEKFYRRLGFEALEADDTHSKMILGDFAIDLVSMRDEPPFTNDSMTAIKGKGMYLYIRVDDVDATYKEMQKDGIEPATVPKDWEWGNREFIVKDPDGYKLCFWQPIA
jgi:uncharacterized glyoxalase superfamily protein PhnB